MNLPEKSRIRASFERAAPTYAEAAAVQRRICRTLEIGLSSPFQPHRILDAGCGTGFAVDLLAARFPEARIIALDFSAAMLTHLRSPAEGLQADLEHLPLVKASIDLYWSSLAVQWCDFEKVLLEARRVLRHGGHLALATLGPETFSELRTAFATVDSHRHTIDFEDPLTLTARMQDHGFSEIRCERQREFAWYPDLRSLLSAVKAAGASQLGQGRRTRPLGKTAFQRAEQAMEAYRVAAGLPLSYDVITLHATR